MPKFKNHIIIQDYNDSIPSLVKREGREMGQQDLGEDFRIRQMVYHPQHPYALFETADGGLHHFRRHRENPGCFCFEFPNTLGIKKEETIAYIPSMSP